MLVIGHPKRVEYCLWRFFGDSKGFRVQCRVQWFRCREGGVGFLGIDSRVRVSGSGFGMSLWPGMNETLESWGSEKLLKSFCFHRVEYGLDVRHQH